MSWPRRLSSWFLILTAALITFHTLLCCGLREGALLIIAACLIPLCLLIGPANSLILSFSLLTITLVLNLGINLPGVKRPSNSPPTRLCRCLLMTGACSRTSQIPGFKPCCPLAT